MENTLNAFIDDENNNGNLETVNPGLDIGSSSIDTELPTDPI